MYISAEDEKWLDRLDAQDVERRIIKGGTETIVEGVTAVKTGGHFDGSLVLHWDEKLFIADTLLTVQVKEPPSHSIGFRPENMLTAIAWCLN